LSPEQRKAHAEMEEQAARLIKAFTAADKQFNIWCVKLADLKDEVIAIRDYFTAHVRGSVTVAGCGSFKAFCKQRLNRSKQAVYKLIGIKGEVERAEAEDADEKEPVSSPEPPVSVQQGEGEDENEGAEPFTHDDRYRFVANCANELIAKVEKGESADAEIAALKAAISIAPPAPVPFGELESTVLLIDLVTVGKRDLANALANCGEDVPEPLRRAVTALLNRFVLIETKIKQETRLETDERPVPPTFVIAEQSDREAPLEPATPEPTPALDSTVKSTSPKHETPKKKEKSPGSKVISPATAAKAGPARKTAPVKPEAPKPVKTRKKKEPSGKVGEPQPVQSIKVDGTTIKVGFTCEYQGINCVVTQIWPGDVPAASLCRRTSGTAIEAGPIPIARLKEIEDSDAVD
jgi:hypothetical protein